MMTLLLLNAVVIGVSFIFGWCFFYFWIGGIKAGWVISVQGGLCVCCETHFI